jgi:hypothetical protein
MNGNVHLNAKKSNRFGENKVKIFPFLDVPLVLQVKLHELFFYDIPETLMLLIST